MSDRQVGSAAYARRAPISNKGFLPLHCPTAAVFGSALPGVHRGEADCGKRCAPSAAMKKGHRRFPLVSGSPDTRERVASLSRSKNDWID